MRAAARWDRHTPSSSTWRARPAPATAGCGRRSPPSFVSLQLPAAARWSWRTLNFTDVRQSGRETLGRGRRGRSIRRIIAGIPTRKFRTLLVGMAVNAGLRVIAVDPGWTSRWGGRYWKAPLGKETRRSVTVTGHHAAAVVIGRRGLGLGARRRSGVPGHDRRIVAGELPARPDHHRLGREGPGPPGSQRAAEVPCKTRPAERSRLGDQVVQDRLGPPGQDTLPVLH
jgi:hypothetical protein